MHDAGEFGGVLDADEQQGHRSPVHAFRGHRRRGRVHGGRDALDLSRFLDCAGLQAVAGGDHVDTVPGRERLPHGLLGAGCTGGDGGDQGHADQQRGAGGGDATRVLLDVGVGNFGARTAHRDERADAAHQHRQPERGGEYEPEEHQRGPADGHQQHTAVIVAGHGVQTVQHAGQLPYGDASQCQSGDDRQNANRGADLSGA